MLPLGYAPRAAVRLAGWLGDALAAVTGREPDVNSAAAAMSLLPHSFCCRRAEVELGYAYRPFETTVQDAWGWFVERGYARPVRDRTVLAR